MGKGEVGKKESESSSSSDEKTLPVNHSEPEKAKAKSSSVDYRSKKPVETTENSDDSDDPKYLRSSTNPSRPKLEPREQKPSNNFDMFARQPLA